MTRPIAWFTARDAYGHPRARHRRRQRVHACMAAAGIGDGGGKAAVRGVTRPSAPESQAERRPDTTYGNPRNRSYSRGLSRNFLYSPPQPTPATSGEAPSGNDAGANACYRGAGSRGDARYSTTRREKRRFTPRGRERSTQACQGRGRGATPGDASFGPRRPPTPRAPRRTLARGRGRGRLPGRHAIGPRRDGSRPHGWGRPSFLPASAAAGGDPERGVTWSGAAVCALPTPETVARQGKKEHGRGYCGG